MLYLLFSPSSGLPKTGIIDIPHFDKFVHFCMFAILSFIFAFDSERSENMTKRIALFSAVSLSFAALSEYIQHAFISGRYGNIYDLISDCVGVIFGIVLYFLIGRRVLEFILPCSFAEGRKHN